MTSPTSETPVLVGTSWKMNKTLAEATAYVDDLVEVDLPVSVDAFILPAHTALSAVRGQLPRESRIRVGTQNAHWAAEGAFTGEISMRMVRDAGATIVELGHSERRAHFGETDEHVALKVAAALDHGLTPLVCVGEPRAVRDAGGTEGYVVAQVRSALSRVAGVDSASVMLAYEPVWSIGEGGTPATPVQVAPVVGAIRRTVAERLVGPVGPVLYGGSVDHTNAAELLVGSGADGLFAGRAGLTASDFVRLLAVCATAHDQGHITPTDREVDDATTTR